MKFKSSSSKGFTLIELLVVVAIISLLSSVVLASLKDARDKAQQTSYRQYLGQLVTAMELYRSSNNGGYPDIGSLSSDAETANLYSQTDMNYLGFSPELIVWQNPPSFVSNNLITIFRRDVVNTNFTCGYSFDDEYFVYFSSSRSDLKFNKVYEDGNPPAAVDPWYCVSPSMK